MNAVEPRIWTLDEARNALPVILEMTEDAVNRSAVLVRELEETILPEAEQESKEDELQAILKNWAARIVSMGAEVKGLWLVDFDNGRGYYCWKYGEVELLFEHAYDGGFAGRRPIADES